MGVARAGDATQLSTTGALVGTPAFMSPEQVEGLATGPASDVFSLGAVLVYAALGRGPFGDANPLVLLRRIADEPADLTGLPEPLREPVAACLAKDPDERPSVAQLVALLGPPSGEPDPAWLPAAVAALIPRPADLQPTVIDGLRHAPTPVVAGPADPPRAPGASRRTVIAGAAAVVGLAVAGGIGVALGTRGTPPAPAPAPPTTELAAPPATPAQRAPARATVRWTASGPQTPRGVVAAQDVVYVGGSGTVVALDVATGGVRWRFDAPAGGVGIDPDGVELAAFEDVVYAATRGGWFALDARTGRLRWNVRSSTTAGYQAYGVPHVGSGGGAAYLAHGNTVRAVDATSGTERWRHRVAGNFAVSPTVDGARILVSDGTGVDALDAATGRLLWRHPADDDNVTELAVADGAVFLAVNGRGVVALDASTGAVRWQAAVGAGGVDPQRPVVVDGVVVVRGRDELLHAFDAATGAPRWDRPDRTNGGGSVATAPATAGGLVYGGSGNGRVYAIEARTGDVRWTYVPPRGLGAVDVLAAAGGTVFAASSRGEVSALDPA
jgi:outer membrane protein assembly factor BamB